MFLAAPISIYALIYYDDIVWRIVSLLTLFITIGIVTARSLPYWLKAGIIVALPLLNGCLVFLDSGSTAGARLYLALGVLLATLLLGFRIGLLMFLLSISAMVLLILVHENGSWVFRSPQDYNDGSGWPWFFFVATYALCVGVILLSAGYLVDRLRSYSEELQAESKALQRAHATEKLARQRYQILADNIIDVVWWLSESWQIQFVSPSVIGQLGYSSLEVQDKDFEAFCATSEIDSFQTALAELTDPRQNKIHIQFELTMIDKVGKEVPVEILASVIQLEDEQNTVVLVSRDITERKALQTSLLQSKKMESLGQLASGVAHDFNNQLAIIQGHVDILDSTALSEVQQKSVEQLIQTVSLAADNTRQILSFGRKQALALEETNLGDFLQNMQPRLLQLLRTQSLQLDISEIPMAVIIDPPQIERCVTNLVVNARDAMSSGGRIIITVIPHAKDTTKFAQISVSDTGTGIDSAIRERIFDPYFSTKAATDGTGLGLSVVNGIVQQHGGIIDLKSVQGEGSTFTIQLPLVEPA